MDLGTTAWHYLQLGFLHVLPLGFDHLLFILTLFFLNSELKSVLLQCTLFTLAHSISLGLSALGYWVLSSQVIEPLIALTILITAIENIAHSKVKGYRLMLVFVFGLIHGMGFATALREVGLPADSFFTALFSFNVGVELAQLSILLLAYFSIGKWFKDKEWYNIRIVYPLSSVIACIAFYLTIQRLLYP